MNQGFDLDPYEHLRVSFSMYFLSSVGKGSKLAGTAFSVILVGFVVAGIGAVTVGLASSQAKAA